VSRTPRRRIRKNCQEYAKNCRELRTRSPAAPMQGPQAVVSLPAIVVHCIKIGGLHTMARAKQGLKRKRRTKAVPVLGAAGLLSLAGGASAGPAANLPEVQIAPTHEFTLGEEEIGDVSLGTFYVFDKEDADSARPDVHLVRGGGRGGGGGGCRGGGRGGGGCRGGGRGCGRGGRGCGGGCGLGGCGCWGGCGCGCCLSWGGCNVC